MIKLILYLLFVTHCICANLFGNTMNSNTNSMQDTLRHIVQSEQNIMRSKNTMSKPTLNQVSHASLSNKIMRMGLNSRQNVMGSNVNQMSKPTINEVSHGVLNNKIMRNNMQNLLVNNRKNIMNLQNHGQNALNHHTIQNALNHLINNRKNVNSVSKPTINNVAHGVLNNKIMRKKNSLKNIQNIQNHLVNRKKCSKSSFS